MSVQESLAEASIGGVDHCRVLDTESSRAHMRLFEGVAIIFITSTIVGSQAKQQGGNRAPPIDRKLD